MTARKLGVHEHSLTAATFASYPGARWTREFIAGRGGAALPALTSAQQLVNAVEAKIAPVLAARGACIISIKVDMGQLAAGQWAERLAVLGAQMAGRPVVVVLWHEPEGDVAAPTFAAGFARGRAAIKAGGPDVDVAYCAMAYQWRPGAAATRYPLSWADVTADLYLVDVYSGKSFPPTAILPEHRGFARWYDEMIGRRTGRRWGIAERGIAAGPDRAATIAREADWLATDPVGRTCEAYLMWATAGAEGNPAWLLDEPAEAAAAALIARLDSPAGYEPSDTPGALIHTATGALIAAGRTSAWDSFFQQADKAGSP